MEIGAKMPPKVLIYVVSTWPWLQTFWPQCLISSSLSPTTSNLYSEVPTSGSKDIKLQTFNVDHARRAQKNRTPLTAF